MEIPKLICNIEIEALRSHLGHVTIFIIIIIVREKQINCKYILTNDTCVLRQVSHGSSTILFCSTDKTIFADSGSI